MPLYAFATRQRLKRLLTLTGNLFTWKGLLCSGTVKALHMGRKRAGYLCQRSCACTSSLLHELKTGAWVMGELGPGSHARVQDSKAKYLHHRNNSSCTSLQNKIRADSREGKCSI